MANGAYRVYNDAAMSKKEPKESGLPAYAKPEQKMTPRGKDYNVPRPSADRLPLIKEPTAEKASPPPGMPTLEDVQGATDTTPSSAPVKAPPPGNYVLVEDTGNAEAGENRQYHYDVTMEGTVQFTSPITGKKITLKPTDTDPRKKKAYVAIMAQLAKSQKVS